VSAASAAPAPARAVAFAVVRRVFERGAWADRALAGEARRARLAPRDLALATRLAYGTVQRARTLDHRIELLADRPAAGLDPAVRAALQLGLYQLDVLSGIPARAAVHESVELARAAGTGRAAGLVNAVLRRAAREPPPALPDATAAQAALAHSVPDWLAELWWAERGAEEARALLRVVNDPPESAVRVNTLVADRDEVAAALPAVPAADLPEALVLTGGWDAWRSPQWRAGAVFPQSRASMLAARALAPEPGERVLDLCAAPGGKTTHLAALMAGRGEIVAVERSASRAAALRRTAARLRADIVTVVEGDAAAFAADAPFDRVLLDPPCSGLGTLQSRPDLRWRARPEEIAALAAAQARMLEAGRRALAPGGTLVYSTCTLSRAENEEVVAHHRPRATRTLLPHRDRTEGFFIARLDAVAG
jgi:16S rRNA (cytosine967-C5)-methyltransferase